MVRPRVPTVLGRQTLPHTFQVGALVPSAPGRKAGIRPAIGHRTRTQGPQRRRKTQPTPKPSPASWGLSLRDSSPADGGENPAARGADEAGWCVRPRLCRVWGGSLTLRVGSLSALRPSAGCFSRCAARGQGLASALLPLGRAQAEQQAQPPPTQCLSWDTAHSVPWGQDRPLLFGKGSKPEETCCCGLCS